MIPFLKNEFKQSIEEKLEDLINIYGIDNIHFSEIFGRSNILGNKIEEFLKKYIKIISVIQHITCLSISRNKIKILNEIEDEELTNEELFFTLFWNLFERVIIPFKDSSIFHIWFEQEDSLDAKSIDKIAKKLINKLNSGLVSIFKKHPEKYISVLNKSVHFFSKKALLYSSLSDLIAYATNKIQQNIDLGIPLKKIQKKHLILLKTIKSIFINYSGLPSKEIINMLDNIQL